MKILQINASYKPAYIYGGPTMSVAALSENLNNAGHTVHVLTTTANGTAELAVNPGEPVTVDGVNVTYFKRITKDHSHLSPGLFKYLWRCVKQFDVIHIHAWWNLVSIGACLIARLRGTPVIVSPRGTLSAYSFGHKNSFLKQLFHECIGKRLLNGSVIHVTSGYEKKAINLLLKPRQVVEIPNFVAVSDHAIGTSVNNDDCIQLLFFSRIDAKKGIDILIAALPLLTMPYRLTVAGNGDADYINGLQKTAKDKGVAENIDWVGFCNADEKFNLLSRHHLLVLPSHDENFANVVIESLSVGTSVLISEYVGLADYVGKNNLGWICSTNVASIAAQVENAWSDKVMRDAIRQRGPEIIRKDFSPETLLKQYVDLYQSVIN